MCCSFGPLVPILLNTVLDREGVWSLHDLSLAGTVSIARELLEMAYVCLILFVYFYTLLATTEDTVLDRKGVWSLDALSLFGLDCRLESC